MSAPLSPFPLRQVHLDFHTSPHIPDVGQDFNAEDFAATMERAHVNSVTIFAKCHHGLSYYPTSIGRPHPALHGRDLLGEMIAALHRRNVRAPIYLSVGWDERLATLYPEWRQMDARGFFVNCPNPDPTRPPQPGGWRFLDWIHLDYQALLERQVRELVERYDVDGLFFDIVMYGPDGYWSKPARAFRTERSLPDQDKEALRRFESAAQDAFCTRFRTILGNLRPGATIFFNSGLEVMSDSTVGAKVRGEQISHFEIESLPSGFWGYYHFPRLARSCGRWGKPWLGQTGRFQKMWGDFGGLKPVPALEFECFRAQAHGGGNSVGDQLPPRGILDGDAYDLIGQVYQPCEAAEPFYENSLPVQEVAIVTANSPSVDGATTALCDEGAVQLCEEFHYEATVVDECTDLSVFRAVLLPDRTIITPRLKENLQQYHSKGGKLMISYRAGFDRSGRWALDFLPLNLKGDTELFPTFWRLRSTLMGKEAQGDRVFYRAGVDLLPTSSLEILADRISPYFKRTDLEFSSHFQTPPVKTPSPHPAIVAGTNFVYFADPIFQEYRESANSAVRLAWRAVMKRLIGAPLIGEGLPSTILSVPRRRGDDLLTTLLHYVPVRKALERDVIEERMSFGGETLRFDRDCDTVSEFFSGEQLPRAHARASFTLPLTKGRLLLNIPGFFCASPSSHQ